MKNKKSSVLMNISAYLFVAIIAGLVFKWYNHIYFTKQVDMIYLILLAAIIISAHKTILRKFLEIISALLFFCSCILQILHWSNVVAFPVIH